MEDGVKCQLIRLVLDGGAHMRKIIFSALFAFALLVASLGTVLADSTGPHI